MNIDLSILKRSLIAASFVFAMGSVQAASLGLTTDNPDIAADNSDIVYTYTAMCTSDDGGADAELCGTTAGNGKNATSWNVASEADSFGLLTIDGSGNFFTDVFESGTDTGYLQNGVYNLDANFNGDGTFSDGSISITYNGTFDLTGSAVGDNFTSGTALIADLADFGFSGTGAAGAFEFTYTNISGDLLAFFTDLNDVGGIIAGTFDQAPVTGDWDSNMSFQGDFAATSNVDTFVPVPAAVWLFGSGLLGLAGFARSRRKI